MPHRTKRSVLKAGVVLLASASWHNLGGAQPPQNRTLLQILRTHRWLTSDSNIRTESRYVPPIAQTSHPANGSPLLFWVEANLDLVRKYRSNPLRATRTFAYLMVAMHDTVLSCTGKYGYSQAHCAIAIHMAAASVIEYLFPEEIRGRWLGEAIVAASRYTAKTASDWPALWTLSQDVAWRVISHALTDGSARTDALAQPPKNIELPWKAAPPLWSTRPVEPGAATWRPWLVPSSIGEQCPPPITLDAERYLKEIQEVYFIDQNLTSQQRKIAEDWNLELGTVTPPGVWLLKAIETPAFLNLSLIEQTGALSLLTTAMMDAFAACWYVKFKWWTERPITAIRRLYDPAFLPHILTPSFPSYPSGHATVSGAAATILANLLPQHQNEWRSAAQEASNSRLYGGIHFRFDNEEGLALGQKIAALAVAKAEINRTENAKGAP
jgi:hypothetical protein